MYTAVLTLHSLARWLVLLAGAYALVRAIAEARGTVTPIAGKSRPNLAFLIATDVQLLLGLLLASSSPTVTTAMANMGAAMHDPTLRFWAVEHATLMILGVILVHIGFARAKRALDTVARGKRAAVPFALGLLCFVLGTPWPWLLVGRPLLRM
jgi:hypothetical protein